MTTEHPFIKFCADRGVTITARQFTPAPDVIAADAWKKTAYAWAVTLRVDGRTLRTSYWCGLGHAKKVDGQLVPTPPSAPDVLVSLLSDAEGVEGRTFAEWAGDFGAEEDSIKALATYKACQRGGKKLLKLLGSAAVVAEFTEASRDW